MHPAVLMGTWLGGNKSTYWNGKPLSPSPPILYSICLFLSLSPSLVLSGCALVCRTLIWACDAVGLFTEQFSRALQWSGSRLMHGCIQWGCSCTAGHGRCTPSGGVGGGGEQGRGELRWGRGGLPASSISNLWPRQLPQHPHKTTF